MAQISLGSRILQLPRTVKVAFALFFVVVSLFLLSTASWDTYSRFTLGEHQHDLALGNAQSAYTEPAYAAAQPSDAKPISHHDQSKVLVVSAFFPLPQSNHPISDYETWFSYFLSNLKTDVYFYAPPDVVPLIKKVRGDLPIYINSSYSSPFDIPPLEGLEDIYIEMNHTFPEKKVHHHKMSGIWNAKAFFLDEAWKHAYDTPLGRGGKHYEYVFWSDAGAMREPNAYENWPEYNRVDTLWEEGRKLSGYMMQKDELFFIPIIEMGDWAYRKNGMNWKDTNGPGNPGQVPWSEGSFLGGPPYAVTWFRQVFYSYHNAWLARGHFVGIDQDLFSGIMLLYPHRFITSWISDPVAPAHLYTSVPEGDNLSRLGACGAQWYYYEWFLSDGETRDKMRDRWLGQIQEPENRIAEGNWDGWWKGSNACRLTNLLWVKKLFEREFGETWVPPQATLVNFENPKPKDDIKWVLS
ncbi:hypothetical protein D9758_004257 [Tetrapyrgos nigripes]|uniref:Uncharacterized protein n=1 Tax=Tetrapyrgos nigripes TaxID=182062 RepID=A0A8H5GU64_9AGAR|nr:hypothetical protein D9758_004257 [Tetrapyrgos nigripes]